jgi:hypothetical protein
MADESMTNQGTAAPSDNNVLLCGFLGVLQPGIAARPADHPDAAAQTSGIPAEGIPAEGIPAEGIPAEDIPAEGIPAEVTRSSSPAGPASTPASPSSRTGDQTCVFVGPAGAGKTCVLATMDAVCYADAGAPTPGLSIMGDGDAKDVKRLLQDRMSWIARAAAPPPTLAETVYSLELTAPSGGGLLGRSHREVAYLRCMDTPGEQYFPLLDDSRGGACDSSISRGQVHQLAEADALVLVIDATQPCLATIEANLPRLLYRMATSISGEAPRQSHRSRILSRLGLLRAHAVPRRTRLSVQRVLLLLTKIDVLAAAMAREIARSGVIVSAVDVAWAIDPLGLAMELVGERTLRRLCRSIGADADFAVGMCSTSGFCGDSGRAFSGWSPGRSPDERERAWTPFGVREALLYIALGRCERTVQRVTETEIYGGEKLAIHDYPFQEAR